MASEKAEADVAKIKKNQRALRESIEQSKRLAEQAERLVRQNRLALSVGDRD